MKTILHAAIVALSLCCTIGTHAINGSWTGKIAVGEHSLTIVLHIDGDTATLDSPDQGAKGIPAQIVVNTPTMLSIKIPTIGMTYTGLLSGGHLSGTFEQNGYKTKLVFEPGEAEKPKRPQTPTEPLPYSTTDITFTSSWDGASLAGTLAEPKEVNAPVVLMISGSGQQNRDEEFLDHRPFAVIADYLACNGIASYRYDDRGVGQSEGLRADITTATNALDAASAIAMLRHRMPGRKIGVLGHSEGGTIAFMLAADAYTPVDFIVSLAGAAERGDTIYYRQLRHAGVPADQCKALSDAQAANNQWLSFFLQYDPAKAISAIECPVMAINGSLDCQVDAKTNLGVIRERLHIKPIDLIKEFEGLNHLFQHTTTGSPQEYGIIEETISPDVLAAIAEWIVRAVK